MSSYPAVVERVIDGDTFETAAGTRIRLANVNTPETGEPGAQAATNFLRNLIGGRTVTVEPQGTDIFGRTLAIVWNTGASISVNQAIRNAGHSR